MDLTFRFPIALFAYDPNNPLRTLDKIMDWCVYQAGLSWIGDLTTREEAAEFARENAPEEFDRYFPHEFEECVACLGAAMMGVTYGEICWVPKSLRWIEKFLAGQDKPSVRNTANVSEQWVWSCFETLQGEARGRTLSWREFRVLAAILSKVGNKSHASCGWREIQARAAGWCGKRAFEAASREEKKRRRPLMLTRDMIRHTLDRLEADRFFARFRYSRCQTWFSFSCDQDRTALSKLVAHSKTRRRAVLAANAAQDRAVSEKIRAQWQTRRKILQEGTEITERGEIPAGV